MFRIRVWTSLGTHYSACQGLPRGLSGKEPTCQCRRRRRRRRRRFDPWARKMTRGGNGYPFQYSCLKNSMDKGAWWAIVRGVAKSQTQLSDWMCTRTHTHTQTHTHTHTHTISFLRIHPMSNKSGEGSWQRSDASSEDAETHVTPEYKRQ